VSMRMANIPPVYVMRDSAWAPGLRDTVTWEPLPDAPEHAMEEPRIDRYAPLVDELIEAIETDRQPAPSVIHSGVNSVAMIQGAFDSCVQGGRVSMPLEQRDHPLERWG